MHSYITQIYDYKELGYPGLLVMLSRLGIVKLSSSNSEHPLHSVTSANMPGSTPVAPINCDIDFDCSNIVGKTAIVTGGK